MFIGRHTLTAHQNNKFAAPRGLLSENYYLTQGFEKNLLLVKKDDFEVLVAHLKQLSITDPLARLLSRLILSNAVPLPAIGEHYIQIPPTLAAFAEIECQAILVGQGQYFEIWSPKLWQEQEARLMDTSSNASRFHLFEIGFA